MIGLKCLSFKFLKERLILDFCITLIEDVIDAIDSLDFYFENLNLKSKNKISSTNEGVLVF